MSDIELLQEMIDKSDNIVFFGGAGTSTESGIKDFRGKDGLYKQNSNMAPEYLLSVDCLYNEPKLFFDYYKSNLNCLDIKPNVTHFYLAELEKSGKLKAIITQNIDGLHQKANSKNVLELHGSVYNNYCSKCFKKYPSDFIFNCTSIPLCECGGIVRPDVVLYGEMLPNSFNDAIRYIEESDLLIVAGTSLVVQPASSLLNYFKGKSLVIINDSTTQYDYKANLVIHKKLGDVFSKLKI